MQLETNQNILDKFSNHFKSALKKAATLALELNHSTIQPAHLFYGLSDERGSIGGELITSLKITPTAIKNQLAKDGHQEETFSHNLPEFSLSVRKTIQKSAHIAYINHHRYIGTEHLLAALLQGDDQEVKRLIGNAPIKENEIIQQAVGALRSASKIPDLTEIFRVMEGRNQSSMRQSANPTYSALELFGNNLTDEKFQEKIDPVIGRDLEINRIIQILSRRTKNNPILLGEPGVGKTAIIEGLAKKITLGQMPEVLKNKKIYTLDLTGTVAGTMYRGEFENRIKQIIDEVKSRPEVILFIDEIHNIVGAGAASGSIDAANILKPALARGEIHCIGATTYHDYRRSIENDPALERRFQIVKIAEPNTDEAVKILRGVKNYFENFHHVAIDDKALETAVTLSQRYLPEKFLPDKAIDLIDEAAATKKINRRLTVAEKRIQTHRQELTTVKKEKENAIDQENFSLAMALKEKEQILEVKIIALEAKQKENKPAAEITVTKEDIAALITKITGVPATTLQSSDKKQIINLEKILNREIIGQSQAVNEVASFIRRAKAGLTAPNRPVATFIFVGPSGVGKTHAAKVIARDLFGSEEALIKIDMSEYSEKFNISKLIGAPAGYVGYKESGQLTERVKHRPYSVVLLDEIEKANPEIFDLLLQIMDDGYLTDAAGTKINFRNTVIIMTSNIGSDFFKSKKGIGFGKNDNSNSINWEEKILEATKNHFKTELINRLDKIIYFQPLSTDDLAKITTNELNTINDRLSDRQIHVTFQRPVIETITQQAGQKTEGARAVKKIIQNLIETPLAEAIIEEKINRRDHVSISIKNGIIKITKAKK